MIVKNELPEKVAVCAACNSRVESETSTCPKCGSKDIKVISKQDLETLMKVML